MLNQKRHHGRHRQFVDSLWGMFLLLMGWLLPTNSVMALNDCGDNSELDYTVHLPIDQDEAYCNIRFVMAADQTFDETSRATFKVEGGGMYEIRVMPFIEPLRIQRSSDSPDIDVNRAPLDLTTREDDILKAELGVDELFQAKFIGALSSGKNPWYANKLVHSGEGVTQTEVWTNLSATEWGNAFNELRLMVRITISLNVRRIAQGCWVQGVVKGETIYGDNAFWSDSPTGIDMNDNPLPIQTDTEADETLEAIVNLDLDPAMLKKLGLKPQQFIDAKNQARKMQLERQYEERVVPESTYDVSEEMAQFKGHAFLTLQSIKSDDDIEQSSESLKGGVLAGPAFAIDMAKAMGHILSQFSTTVEFQRSELVEGWTPVRAGLASEGLKYTWDGKTGREPVIELRKCDPEAKDLDALCGKLTWADIAEIEFRALKGAFACINN